MVAGGGGGGVVIFFIVEKCIIFFSVKKNIKNFNSIIEMDSTYICRSPIDDAEDGPFDPKPRVVREEEEEKEATSSSSVADATSASKLNNLNSCEFEKHIRTNSRFFIQILQFHTIKNLFEVLGNIMGNVKWQFAEKEIKMNSFNKKQGIIAAVELFPGVDNFEYLFSDPTEIVMNVKNFFTNTMKSNKKKDIISMYVLKDSPKDLKIVYNNRSHDQATKINYFSLRDEVAPVSSYSYPIIPFEFYFTVKCTVFHSKIRQRQKSDIFELAISKNKVRIISNRKISCTREDVLFESNTSVIFSPNIGNYFKNEDEMFFGPFSCRKINLLYKLHHSSSNVTVLLNTQKRKTLTMRYSIGSIGQLNVIFEQEREIV
jgi:hypothetical protein